MQFQSYPDHAFKKRKSRSPSPGPACKRRVPASYTPSLYASIPPSFPRSLSVEALASGTPTSERASPGLDWLHQTQQLGLKTPPVQEEEKAREVAVGGGDVGMGFVGSGGGGEGMDDAMQDDPPPAPPPATPFHLHSSSSSHPHQPHHIHQHHPHPHPHHPSQHTYTQHPALSSSAGFAFADPTFMPIVPSLPSLTSPTRPAPHDAPPLHNHLAGSPQPHAPASNGMTPSSSTSSLYQSMAYGQGLPHALELAMEQDAVMSGSSGGAVPGGGGGGGKAGQGGWKLTMGFRQDCEKCRNREPGHYSHLVPPH